MNRWLAVPCAAAVVMSGCGWQQAKFKATHAAEVAHVAGTAISVTGANGAVTVERDEARTDVRIVAEVRGVTQERADAVTILAERGGDGTLTVTSVWPDRRRGNESCSFVIHAPSVTDVRIVTSNGAITLGEANGNAWLETSNGRITAKQVAGRMDANSSNGAIVLEGVRGEIAARTSNGSITIEEAMGVVSARTSNGAISIQLAEANAGPVTAKSSNGAITLAYGQAFTGALSLDTSNGRVSVTGLPESVTLPKKLDGATLAIGDGGASKLETSNGSITVRRR